MSKESKDIKARIEMAQRIEKEDRQLRHQALTYLTRRDVARYEETVRNRIANMRLPERAKGKIGFIPANLLEINPVYMNMYEFDDQTGPTCRVTVVGGVPLSSDYSSTQIYFGTDRLYVYNIIFSMTDNYKKEFLCEIFYNDISAVKTVGETVIIDEKNLLKEKCLIECNYMEIYFDGGFVRFPVEAEADRTDNEIARLKNIIGMKRRS